MQAAWADEDEDFDLCDDYDFAAADSDDDDFDTHPQASSTPATTPLSGSSSRLSRPKNLKCPYENCEKAFNRQSRLKEHIRSHTNERPFKCSYFPCTKSFLRDSHLKHHVKSQHQKIRDHKCDYEGCGKSFTTATRLRRHIDTHEGQKFQCAYADCGQEFRKQGTLDRHILSVHHNIRPFPCQEADSVTGQPCEKAYDTAENLRAHQRAKHDLSRFSCIECQEHNEALLASGDLDPSNQQVAAFCTYGEFQAHLKIVHPPTCPQCPTSFTTNKELTRHLELQHGVLPPDGPFISPSFVCDHIGCGKAFTKKGNLNVHIKTVHESRRDFVCGETEMTILDEDGDQDVVVKGCARSFTSRSSLEEHIRTAHLGLDSKRKTRDKKRKATNTSIEGELPKKRKPRKDKGVKRTSTMASLVGGPAKQEDILYYGTYDPVAGDLDFDDNLHGEGLLSGSVTMLGNQIYYGGNTYEYPAGEYPNSPLRLSTLGVDSTAATASAAPAATLDEDIFEFERSAPPTPSRIDDALFGAFEQHCLRDDV
ncbi:hypothetical protein B0A52_01644 [Exophiala mesophila]|uniref:C2H2-type domain-containing protein n=1 Tax=Exophiala mesophila TaxID=212818 RepID=A0A438NFK8_EXOME|nr:hypothetical protein B0A52_01644 [Exophiala mesophila]